MVIDSGMNYFAAEATTREPVGLSLEALRRHVYVIGKTGYGKSWLVENILLNNLKNGQGACVIDPYGDMADQLLTLLPPERQGDVMAYTPDETAVAPDWDYRMLIDTRKIIIAKLAKGTIGEEKCWELGKAILKGFSEAGIAREDAPVEQRPDFSILIDEFQDFVTSDFLAAMPELRKYNVNLILAQQYTEQMDATYRTTMLENMGNKIFFAIGRSDAEVFAAMLFPDQPVQQTAWAEKILDLPKYHIFMNVGGKEGVQNTWATTLPPAESV